MSEDEAETGPERTCIVTRRKGAPDTMVRFVVGPDEMVVPDIRRKLPGRGLWVTAREPVVAEAVRKSAFPRGFRRKVAVDAELARSVGDLLERDALQSLAMANKAGVVVTGFAKVETAIVGGAVVAVLHATEAAADGVRKIEAAARRAADSGAHRSDDGPLPIKLFSAEQLELALGRTNVIHAALAAGPASHAFLTRCHRLIDYRSGAAHELIADAKGATV